MAMGSGGSGPCRRLLSFNRAIMVFVALAGPGGHSTWGEGTSVCYCYVYIPEKVNYETVVRNSLAIKEGANDQFVFGPVSVIR